MAGDTRYLTTSLLLSCNGTNGSTTFTDNSAYPLTVTPTGNVKIVTATSKYGGASAYFDGSNDLLSVPSSPKFYLTSTFTVECWLYPLTLTTAGNSCRVIMCGVNNSYSGMCFYLNPSGVIGIGVPQTGTSCSSATGVVTTDGFHHYAWVVNSGSATIYKDGVLVAGPIVITLQDGGLVGLVIGYDTAGTSNYQYNGYIDDLRISKSVARYLGPFTPPTELPTFLDPAGAITTGAECLLWNDRTTSKNPFKATATFPSQAAQNQLLYNDIISLNLFRFSASNAIPDNRRMLFSDLTPSPALFRVNFPLVAEAANVFIDQRRWIQFINWTGNYKIAGKVQVNSVNVAYKWVYIFPESAPDLCIGAQYTDATGSFSFNNLSLDRYTVYAMDPNFSYNGKLFENIQSVSQ